MATTPTKSYPAEWEDEQVMKVFFSPFRENREVNPRSWDSKMKFWTDMIHRHCRDKCSVTINAKQLPVAFERKGYTPTCLHVVLEDLIRRGVVQKFSDYRTSVDPSWVSWSMNWFVKKPVLWGFSTLIKRPLSWAYGSVVGREDIKSIRQPLPDEQFVVVELVKTMADSIYRLHCESVANATAGDVVGYTALRLDCTDICSDEMSFELAILDLCRRKLCTVVTDSDGERILHMITNETTKRSAPLLENSLQIYKLKTLQTKLEKLIAKNNYEIEQCRLEAKACIKQGNKSAALKLIKKKKKLESEVEKKEVAIDKLTDMIDIIENTESQKEIVDAYSGGVVAFKDMTHRHGLTMDKIDDTMLNIQEAFEVSEQINQSISTRIDPFNIAYDDTELEQELNDLVSGNLPSGSYADQTLPRSPVRVNAYALPDIINLPGVPDHEPTSNPPARQRPPTSPSLY